jgi:CO/xanthine dehydrogenase FAD-binding subunit
MLPFSYTRPGSAAEAFAVLAEGGPRARALAGGTDLIVGLRQGTVRPAVVVALKGVPELAGPVSEVDGRLVVPALAPMTELVAHPTARSHFPALVESAVIVGSIQIRNRATLAGNVCNASPAADTVPALLVHHAVVTVIGPSSQRDVPLAEFILGPRRVALEPGELVSSVALPLPERPTGAAFARMTRRRGVDLASVNLCCAVDADGRARFAFGAVGPRAFLATDDSGVLADPLASEEARDQALDAVLSAASPISDVRAGQDYRRAMLRVLTRRALERARQRLARRNGDA